MRTHMSMTVRLVLKNYEVMVVGAENVARALKLEEKYRRGFISAWMHDREMQALGNY